MSVLKKIKFHPKKKDMRRKIKNFRLVGKAKAQAGGGGQGSNPISIKIYFLK